MVHPKVYFSTSCQWVSWIEPLAKENRAIWPPREKHFSCICLFLCLVEICLTFHFLLALSVFCPHLCNLPHPKRVPERSLCSKIGINRTAFKEKVMLLTGLNVRVERVEVVDYTQKGDPVCLKCWSPPPTAVWGTAASRPNSLRAAAWWWRSCGLLGRLCSGEGMLLRKTTQLRQCSSCLD